MPSNHAVSRVDLDPNKALPFSLDFASVEYKVPVWISDSTWEICGTLFFFFWFLLDNIHVSPQWSTQDPALAAVLPLIDGVGSFDGPVSSLLRFRILKRLCYTKVRSVQTIANDSPLRSDYVWNLSKLTVWKLQPLSFSRNGCENMCHCVYIYTYLSIQIFRTLRRCHHIHLAQQISPHQCNYVRSWWFCGTCSTLTWST